MKSNKKAPKMKIIYKQSKNISKEEAERRLSAVYDWIFDQVAKEINNE